MNLKNLNRKALRLTAPLALAAAMVAPSRPVIAQQDQQQPAATKQDQQPQPAPPKKSGGFGLSKLKNAVKTAQNKVQEAKDKAQAEADKIHDATGGLVDFKIQGARKLQAPKQFGDVPVGTSKDIQILATTHEVGAPVNGNILYVDSVEISGRDKNDFQIIQNSDLGPHANGDVSLITVRFTPSHQGKEKATITENTHSLTQNGHSWSTPAELVGNGITGRAFFYIAYVNEDKKYNPGNLQSFPFAARTWEDEIKQKYGFKEGQDIFIDRYAHDPLDFVKQWGEVSAIISSGNYVAVEGAIFSHSSEPGLSESHGLVLESGLEFANEPGIKDPLPASGTLTKEMIDALVKINWDKNGELELFGCNTAVARDISGWSPAGEFAKIQNITTQGEDGFASFSENKVTYVRISASSTKMYLEAFYKTNIHGVVIGPGTRIDPIIFKPPQP